MPSDIAEKFRQFVLDEYSAKYINFDPEYLITWELDEFVEWAYSDMCGDLGRRYFNYEVFVNDCIDDDDYKYYYINEKNEFEESEFINPEVSSCPFYNKDGEKYYKFVGNENEFLCVYEGKELIEKD